MITAFLVTAQALSGAASGAAAPAAQPLAASATVRGTLAGGQSTVYSIEVPAHQAAAIVVTQDGIDVTVTLRRPGEALIHGLDMRAGPDGVERQYVPVADAPQAWLVKIGASLPKAARGDYTISYDLRPADDRARAVAEAYRQYQLASDLGWGGDAESYRQALVWYDSSADAAEKLGLLPLAAEAVYQSARVHDVTGDFPGAIERQQRALALFRSAGLRDREARVLNRLGDLSRKIGEVTNGERYFTEALPLARESRDPATIADILNNSGLLLLSIGRVEPAIEQLRDAIPLAQEVDSASVESALLLNIGNGYVQLGVYDKAIDMYRRGLDVTRRMNLPRRLANMHTALARALFERGDQPAAEENINLALGLYEEGGDRTGRATLLGIFGRMLHAAGEDDRALEVLARARPLLHEAQSRVAEAQALATWADIEVDRGLVEPALAKLDDALALVRVAANPGVEQRVLYIRARALQQQHRLDEAIASIAAATAGVETMRDTIVRSELRTSYLARVRSYFDLHIDLLQQKGSTREAFEMSERARARTLLDGLAESASKIQKGVDPALLAKQRSIQAELNAKESYRAQVALTDGASGARTQAIARDIDRLLEQWTDVRAEIRTSSPAYWALQAPEPATVERVQRTLVDASSALVEYHLGAARSYVWLIDRQSIAVRELPPVATIDEVARRYHQLLSRDTAPLGVAERARLAKDIDALGARLAALVWKPIEARVRGKRLLIVADGVLQYVPFAALPASAGEPILAGHEIAYLPSASVLDSIRRRSRPVQAGAAVAVFADPVFSKSDARFAARRNTATIREQSRADDAAFARLRFSRDEAAAIGAVSPGAFAALDFRAAKQTLTSRDLRGYRILHFATHGSLDTAHPELSGLVLSLVDAAGKPVDGFLRLHEIYNLDLDADLVVLSACRTALGKDVHGEGLIGLTRGFMYAGASRVVSSVWNVDDRASAQLMARFYEEMLTNHRSPASALREAQLALLRNPRFANPHYWAAFGLQGDWR